MTALGNTQKKYTYDDYKTWDDEQRVELIDGIVYAMSAPSQSHQRVLSKIARRFGNYLEGKSCEVFQSPSDVRLNYDKEDNTVVQPDMFVVCNKSKLDGQNCNGAPDLVLEVLSPSTKRKDEIVKLNKYIGAGVKEYWIVHPEEKIIYIYAPNGKFDMKAYTLSDDKEGAFEPGTIIKVGILEGLEIDLKDIFAEV